MHHFCATEVCLSLGLKDDNGEDIAEYPNDACFCSKECCIVRPGAIRASKRKRVRTNHASSESGYSDGDDDDHVDGEDDDYDSSADFATKSEAKKKSRPVKATKKPSKIKGREPQKQVQADEAPSVWPPPKPKKAPPKPKRVELPRDRDPLIGRMVAFSADMEDWMPSKLYKEAKGLYLSGRVHEIKRQGRQATDTDLFEIRWTVTSFQKREYFHHIPRAKVEEGIRNHTTLSGSALNGASWRHLCQAPDSEAVEDAEDLENCVILDGSSDVFISRQALPDNLELVEQITTFDFQPS
jgi:hypothetical protein